MTLYPTPNADNASAGYNYVNQPVRSLNETKFDGRLDHTLSSTDNLFARFSYDQAFSYVPGGSPGFAEANAFGSNQHISNHARNVALGETHVFSPTMVNQATFGYNRIFDYITSQGTGTCASANLVPAAFPAPTWDAPAASAFLEPTVAVWFPPSSPATIGPSAIAATPPSRAEPTSSPSATPSTSPVASMTSTSASTSAAIK